MRSPSRQNRQRLQLLAVALGPLSVYTIFFTITVLSDQPYSPRDFIAYTTVISIPVLIWLLVLLRYVCGERPRDLNLRSGRWASDLLAAAILSVVTLAANVVVNALLPELLPAPPNTAVVDLFDWLARNPGMLALFLGVLLWIGVAQEELTRVFLLSRLWKVWPSAAAKWLAILFAACLFGLAHGWQGPTRIVWTGIYGVIMGAFYLRFGRVAPLIISHYLTNGLQIVVFTLRMRG